MQKIFHCLLAALALIFVSCDNSDEPLPNGSSSTSEFYMNGSFLSSSWFAPFEDLYQENVYEGNKNIDFYDYTFFDRGLFYCDSYSDHSLFYNIVPSSKLQGREIIELVNATTVRKYLVYLAMEGAYPNGTVFHTIKTSDKSANGVLGTMVYVNTSAPTEYTCQISTDGRTILLDNGDIYTRENGVLKVPGYSTTYTKFTPGGVDEELIQRKLGKYTLPEIRKLIKEKVKASINTYKENDVHYAKATIQSALESAMPGYKFDYYIHGGMIASGSKKGDKMLFGKGSKCYNGIVVYNTSTSGSTATTTITLPYMDLLVECDDDAINDCVEYSMYLAYVENLNSKSSLTTEERAAYNKMVKWMNEIIDKHARHHWPGVMVSITYNGETRYFNV